jgi:hypothetical protein
VRSDRPDDEILRQIPWVWLIAEKRWVANGDSFLAPQSHHHDQLLPWLTSCNMCHSVGTEPHLHDGGERSRSAELGIACEACHGPGEAHVAAYQSPVQRYARHLDATAADSTIVNPARLDKERSTEVCGQCHSFNKQLDLNRWSRTGVAYRPGDRLDETIAVFRYTDNPTHPLLLEHLEAEPLALAGRFWRDGTIRVAGREYNGLLESKCHTHGEMTCLSCHSMHRYREPADQLAAHGSGDDSCLQCHADYADRIEAHTHHRAESGGARCMNCHMPHTTFGLMTAMRSHRVDSPSAAVSAATGRPNACNLCHLDQTLSWTAQHLTAWYGQAPVALSADQSEFAAAILWVTAGDGAQRAVTAWAMGWDAAHQASGRGWQGAFLTELLRDPYAVTRQVAYRSLRALPGFDRFEFDYVAAPERLAQRAQEGFRLWMRAASRELDRRGAHLLLDGVDRLDIRTHSRLLEQRDHSPIRIIE